MNKEIERKYKVSFIPKDFKVANIVEIEQAFIYKDTNTIIRIRKVTSQKEKETNYIYTVKTKGDIEYNNNYDVGSKYEIENFIKQEEYEELLPQKISNSIQKTRIVIPIEGNLKVEIDIYKDYLEGLVTAEIEFPTEEIAKNYKKPEWLGEELGYKELSNRKLAEMTKEEFKTKVSKEFMENNKKVIKALKDLNIIKEKMIK